MIQAGKDIEPLEDLCVHCSRSCVGKFYDGQLTSSHPEIDEEYPFGTGYIVECPRFKSRDEITRVATALVSEEYS